MQVPVQTTPSDSLPMVALLVAHGATVSDGFIAKVTKPSRKLKARPPVRVVAARHTLVDAVNAVKDIPEADRDPDRFLHLLVNDKCGRECAEKIR